jgi:RNA polymerase sigma-70 factor, ECF subfamily
MISRLKISTLHPKSPKEFQAIGLDMTMEQNEIAGMIREVLCGKSAEFSRLVREFGLPVRSFIHSRVRNVADAEDIAQETFIAAFRGLSRFDPTQNFEAWLIGIARHRVLGHFRSNERRHRTNERFREECLALIESELCEAEGRFGGDPVKRLMDCVEKLPERMRQVIRARLRGENGSMAAKLLKTTCGAIYMLQLRANEQLRECMMKPSA